MAKILLNLVGCYSYTPGSFGFIKDRPNGLSIEDWTHCREIFQQHNKLKHFVYHGIKPNKVISFIKDIEKKLKLKKVDRLVFSKTNHVNVIYIKMSDWWRVKHRRSLLTALLRAGSRYRSNLSATINKGQYLSATKSAVDRFLDGHVNYRKKTKFTGWYDEFRGMNKEAVKRLLK